MKIITIIGARPQFIKAAMVSKAIDNYNLFNAKNQITEIIVHTGQHFDDNMNTIFFEQMGIRKPDYNLNISNLSHGAMVGRMLEKIDSIIELTKPDWVLVYGDTNSTIAGALAAKKMHIKIAHVEAGLRSFNERMPEEINRIVTDRISDVLFCPTEKAMQNLSNEGFDAMNKQSILVGDVMYDAAKFFSEKALAPLKEHEMPQKFCLATLHRAENTDDPKKLKSIIEGLHEISSELPIIFPLHPRTKHVMKKYNFNLNRASANIITIDPVGYLQMIYLLKHCELVITDSGGLQKEAYFFQKNCLTLREETEWTELVDNGYNILAGNSINTILSSFNILMHNKANFNKQLYGNGKTAEIIVKNLLNYKE